MGGFQDESQLYSDDDNYDAEGVAQYIVQEGDCLNLTGELLNDDGSITQFKFEII